MLCVVVQVVGYHNIVLALNMLLSLVLSLEIAVCSVTLTIPFSKVHALGDKDVQFELVVKTSLQFHSETQSYTCAHTHSTIQLSANNNAHHKQAYQW